MGYPWKPGGTEHQTPDSRFLVRQAAVRRSAALAIHRKQEDNMPELKEGCVKPTRGPILPAPPPLPPGAFAPPQEAAQMLARVGQPVIDFESTAFIEGVGFQPVKLSDYKGK
jgi:hypothetical protein